MKVLESLLLAIPGGVYLPKAHHFISSILLGAATFSVDTIPNATSAQCHICNAFLTRAIVTTALHHT